MDKSRPEIIPADKKAQYAVLVFIMVILVLGSLLFFYLQKLQLDITNRLETAAEEALAKLGRFITQFKSVNIIVATLISIYLFYLMLKTLQSGQYPPPGTKVVSPTRVRRGTPARVMAFFLLVIILLIIGITLYLNHFLSRLLGMLT
ncbi:MAG: hypothetical protein JXB60_00715 [Candidatus Cloacimonetes bacterium]|nr:hypothetical protein [Candidatus Cloacimonadota bacterium]